ncbi:MAG TPA: TetR/AcrR family transcriptional regulator [Gemmatimonadaceae bacterium]|nr:TetR/AcrR family transcriptional regulator [Gemmatimonadaceae bacterium]
MTISRERVLTCACDLYLADGLDGFSMRRLASELGVTAPALYRHYPAKEALLRDVVAEAFKVFGAYLYRALEGTSPQERLRLTGEGYVAFALDHPRFYEVIHASPRLLGFAELPEVASQSCGTKQFLVDRVRECMDARVLAPDDPEVVAAVIWAFSHGLVSLFLGGALPVQRAGFLSLYQAAFARLFAGIGGDAFVPRLDQPDLTALDLGLAS